MKPVWRELPRLPRALGGVFAGSVSGRLIVAGGSYWEGAPWIPGSRKIFVDAIYAYDRKAWRQIGKLPRPMGYGASFVHDNALWLVGGQDANGPLDLIYCVDTGTQGRLPAPLMMPAYAKHEGRYYLLGGQPDLKTCLRSADLQHWQPAPPWPGPGRFFAQACSAPNGLYLAGGTDLAREQRVFLKDGYRLQADQWQRIADLPLPVQAGFAAAPRGIPHIFGGNDGNLSLMEADFADLHPGFSTVIWKWEAERWRPAGLMPYAPVTSTLVEWEGELVVPGGEDRPAHRSSRVIAGKDFED
ncbi:MAG: Kelch repeat-containing protein [Acidobacteriota bacterium]